MIFLGLNKTETMFMIFFTPNIVILIFFGSVDGSNPDFYLHCFGIFYVHVQVSRYEIS